VIVDSLWILENSLSAVGMLCNITSYDQHVPSVVVMSEQSWREREGVTTTKYLATIYCLHGHWNDKLHFKTADFWRRKECHPHSLLGWLWLDKASMSGRTAYLNSEYEQVLDDNYNWMHSRTTVAMARYPMGTAKEGYTLWAFPPVLNPFTLVDCPTHATWSHMTGPP
jgi:hypothetical protein